MVQRVKTDKSIKYLETTKEVYPLVTAYYEEAERVKNDHSKAVVWFTGGGTPELAWAFEDILPVYPENFNAYCATRQITPELLEIAESAGYAHDLCGYFRNCYGYMLGGKDLPLGFAGGGLPVPDILIADSDACLMHLKWWRQAQRFYDYKVPTYIIDIPYISPRMSYKNIERHYLEYVMAQIKECLQFIGNVMGRKLDEDRLKEVIRLSDKAAELFDEVQELRKAVPCPAGSEDILACIMPLVQWSGSQAAVDFYTKLRNEVREKVAQGKGVVPEEKFRIFFDNIPPWFTLGLFNYLHKFNAVSVQEAYTYLFHLDGERMDPDKPYESLARRYIASDWYNVSVKETIHDLVGKKMIDYNIDGVIAYILYGCKITSGFMPEQRNILEEKFGVPSLLLEGDMVDPRDYQDAQVKNRIDAFFEMLDNRGKR